MPSSALSLHMAAVNPEQVGWSQPMRVRNSVAIVLALWTAPAAASSFESCVAGLREQAVSAGVSRSLASRALDLAQPDEKVLRLSQVQPETKARVFPSGEKAGA